MSKLFLHLLEVCRRLTLSHLQSLKQQVDVSWTRVSSMMLVRIAVVVVDNESGGEGDGDDVAMVIRLFICMDICECVCVHTSY